MAAQFAVGLVFKSLGAGKLNEAVNKLNGVDTAAKKTQGSIDKLTGKFSKSGQAIRKSAGGLEYFIDKLGRARKANGQFVTSAEAAANSIAKTGRAAKAAKGPVDGLNRSIRNLVTGAALLAGAKFVFSKTAELERTTKQLATVTGSLQTAKGILNELQVINKKSPFSFIELADTAKRLSAFGIANKDLVGTTERLGKAAAATGANVNDLSLAYGQVAAKGKLQTEELYQFQERGIPLLDELAKGYGKTKGEVQELITAGQVGFPAVEQAIKNLTTGNGKFAKSFENTADTLDAKLSNAIDSLGRAAAAFGELLKPSVLEALQGAEKLLTDITGVLKLIPQPAANAALKFAELALKMLAVKKAIDLVIGLKAGLSTMLLGVAGNATTAGNASAIAAGKVAALAAALRNLAAIGIVTVGVNYLINGIASGARQEDLLKGLESGEFDNTLQNLPYDQAQAALRQEERTLTGLLAKRDKLQKELKDSAGGFLSLIPGIGPARIGAKRGELNEIEAQIQKSQRILSSKTQAPPKPTTGTTGDDPFALLDGNSKGNGKGTRKAAASAPRATFISIEELGRALQGMGYTVKEHPSFGGVSGGHASNSYHKYGEALDVTDHRSGDWMGRTKQLENQLRGSGAGFAELMGPASGAAGHETHIHIAAASGKVQLTPELAAVLGLPGAGERGASALQVMNQQAEEMMQKLAQGRQTIEGIVSDMQGGTQGLQDKYDDSQLRDRLELEGMSAEQIGIQLERSQQLREVERSRVEALAKVAELAKEGLIPVDEIRDAQEKITAEYEKQAGLIDTLAQGEMKRAEASGKGKIQSKIEEYKKELADTEGMIVSLAGTVESEIGSAMSNAITGLIDGTTTAQEAFSSMFKNIGKAFIDMATQMIAKALIMKALGILAGGGTPATPGLNESGGGLPLGELSGSMPWSSWAGGGYTGDGSRSGGVDGQGGFPAILHPQETVVDHTKGMNKWSSGNSAGSNSGGLGGKEGEGGKGGFETSPISITMDTRVINNVEYATAAQMQEMSANAAAEGAKRGEAMALRKLQMSPAARRRIGL